MISRYPLDGVLTMWRRRFIVWPRWLEDVEQWAFCTYVYEAKFWKSEGLYEHPFIISKFRAYP